jgi:hypothetical protein
MLVKCPGHQINYCFLPKESVVTINPTGGSVSDKNLVILFGIVIVVLVSFIPALVRHLRDIAKEQKKK